MVEQMRLRVAIIHDWLNQVGGAENVLEAFKELFPEAPIYTSMYWQPVMPPAYRNWDIRVSFMDRLPLVKRRHQLFLPLYPLAFESFDLRGYDLVLSNKSGFCHGVITPPETPHLCYCLTPTRYLWNTHEYVEREGLGRLARLALLPFLALLRLWDRLAADRVDSFAAISTAVQRRIRKYYGRDSVVIHPPVDTARYQPADKYEDYFLVVSRLVPYKRVDLAIQACTELNLPLVIAGEGRDRARLEKMAGPSVRFLGRVSGADVARLMAHCRAFIFPGLEDFGIAPVEAQASGRPVVAFRGGGALDTVVEGQTGLFFDEQSPEALTAALARFDPAAFDPDACRANAERFDKRVFARRIQEWISFAVCPSSSCTGAHHVHFQNTR